MAAAFRRRRISNRARAHRRARADGHGQRRFQPLGIGSDARDRNPAGHGRAARSRTPTDRSISTPSARCWREAEDDPAFAALMLMPPTENELATAKTPVDPDAITCAPACADPRHRRDPWPDLQSSMNRSAQSRRFLSRREIGRPTRPAQCVPALSHRRRRRSRGGAGRRPLSRRHQHDRHDRGPRGADAAWNSRCAMRPSPISMTASAAIRWCSTNGWGCRRARPCRKPPPACAR